MTKVFNKHTAPLTTVTGVTINPGETVDNYEDTNNHLSSDPFVQAGWLVVGKDADAAEKAANSEAEQAEFEQRAKDAEAKLQSAQQTHANELKAKDERIAELEKSGADSESAVQTALSEQKTAHEQELKTAMESKDAEIADLKAQLREAKKATK